MMLTTAIHEYYLDLLFNYGVEVLKIYCLTSFIKLGYL